MQKQLTPLGSKTSGFAYSFSAICYLIVSLIFSLIVGSAKIGETTDLYLYLSYLSAAFAVALSAFAVLKIRRQSFSVVVTVKCHYKYYIIALLMIFGLVFSVSNINSAVLELLKLCGYTPRGDESYVPDLSGGMIVPAILVIALLPALFEEFLFRGVIFKNLQASAGDVASIFSVGLCFALFHASAEQTVYQFICGCAFTFLAVRSGSILPCVLMHFLNNAIILSLAAAGIYNLPSGVNIALIVVGAVCFATAILLLIFDKKPLRRGSAGGVKDFYIYASAGLLLFLILFIASFFRV